MWYGLGLAREGPSEPTACSAHAERVGERRPVAQFIGVVSLVEVVHLLFEGGNHLWMLSQIVVERGCPALVDANDGKSGRTRHGAVDCRM